MTRRGGWRNWDDLMDRKSAWMTARARLEAAGVDSPALDARMLVEAAAGITRTELLADPYTEISPEAARKLEALVARRAGREPISHLLGEKEFWGLPFIVTKDVLTPRPDSEAVVEAVLGVVRDSRIADREGRITNHESRVTILDLGTGTGCLLLSLLSELPHARGVGVDASAAALEIARKNAEKLGLAGRVEFEKSQWCQNVDGVFEIVVANPPYIASNEIGGLMPEVAEYEPHLALDGGSDGLKCYREIAAQLPKHTREGSIVALEVGAGQIDAVQAIFEDHGFRAMGVKADLAGIARCLILKMQSTKGDVR